jgi:long-chain fatty acid adenylase/transferase FadD26
MTHTTPAMRGDVVALPEMLRQRSASQPDAVAYVFLRNGEAPADTLTYRALWRAAQVRAARFVEAGIAGGTAVLVYPSGTEFVATLLGCMAARVIGAPVQVPRRREALAHVRRIADDMGTSTVLTTTAVKTELLARFGDGAELGGLTLLATDAAPDAVAVDDWVAGRPDPAGVALLQYTSGSTGDPKGVVVTHRNFWHNVRETDELWPCQPDGTVVNWLPLFHDMGLLFGVVMPLWAGIPSYLMAPDAFIRRPARWLEAIARFGGTHSAAPSFAYELCARAAEEGATADVGDLSAWRVAANGAEPVRWSTVTRFIAAFAAHGFRPEAMCPGYGLAENTLKVTGTSQHRPPGVRWVDQTALTEGAARDVDAADREAWPAVSCGTTVSTTDVRIVDPLSRAACPPGRVGEILVSGPGVADGYWRRPELSEAVFRAHIDGDGRGRFLRTGDLGFLRDGELYVTGRLKDLIIRHGRNHYPQDIEHSAELALPGLHPNCAAAFSADDGETERLVVLVEVDGRVLRVPGAPAARHLVHRAIWENHRLDADEVVLVRRGTLSRTSSGKIQRAACRRRYLAGALTVVSAPAERPVPVGEGPW